jgi:hypothetical protein
MGSETWTPMARSGIGPAIGDIAATESLEGPKMGSRGQRPRKQAASTNSPNPEGAQLGVASSTPSGSAWKKRRRLQIRGLHPGLFVLLPFRERAG